MKAVAVHKLGWCQALAIAALACLVSTATAAPLFLPPAFLPHPPGAVLHLPPTGPLPLPPGGVIGPIPYADPLPALDLHHVEFEVHNPIANPFQVFGITFTMPIGTPGASGTLSLPPGSSAYFDFHVFDGITPFDVWPFWSITHIATPGALLAPITIDTSVFEDPFVLIPPAPGLGGPPAFLPGPGAGFVPGPAPAPVMITVVPEPASIGLLGMALVMGLPRRRSA